MSRKTSGVKYFTAKELQSKEYKYVKTIVDDDFNLSYDFSYYFKGESIMRPVMLDNSRIENFELKYFDEKDKTKLLESHKELGFFGDENTDYIIIPEWCENALNAIRKFSEEKSNGTYLMPEYMLLSNSKQTYLTRREKTYPEELLTTADITKDLDMKIIEPGQDDDYITYDEAFQDYGNSADLKLEAKLIKNGKLTFHLIGRQSCNTAIMNIITFREPPIVAKPQPVVRNKPPPPPKAVPAKAIAAPARPSAAQLTRPVAAKSTRQSSGTRPAPPPKAVPARSDSEAPPPAKTTRQSSARRTNPTKLTLEEERIVDDYLNGMCGKTTRIDALEQRVTNTKNPEKPYIKVDTCRTVKGTGGIKNVNFQKTYILTNGEELDLDLNIDNATINGIPSGKVLAYIADKIIEKMNTTASRVETEVGLITSDVIPKSLKINIPETDRRIRPTAPESILRAYRLPGVSVIGAPPAKTVGSCFHSVSLKKMKAPPQ